MLTILFEMVQLCIMCEQVQFFSFDCSRIRGANKFQASPTRLLLRWKQINLASLSQLLEKLSQVIETLSQCCRIWYQNCFILSELQIQSIICILSYVVFFTHEGNLQVQQREEGRLDFFANFQLSIPLPRVGLCLDHGFG